MRRRFREAGSASTKWYVLTRGLAAGVNGGGGKVGNWTGDKPNFTGELLQLGVRK
ncbi:unnamed protein product [Gemmataceae bacterium]|nr:unnamed protein product [Gemmataceae bacterium]VTT96336.1 unnamed protein product [Gemmataceae bacterium]